MGKLREVHDGMRSCRALICVTVSELGEELSSIKAMVVL